MKECADSTTHGQGVVEVVEHRDDDWHDLALLDGGQDSEVNEEGREGSDAGGGRDAQALGRVDAHRPPHPLRHRVGEGELLNRSSRLPSGAVRANVRGCRGEKDDSVAFQMVFERQSGSIW